MNDIDFTKILHSKKKDDFIKDEKCFSLVYIEEISKWIMCCDVFWIAYYQRYYLVDDNDVDLYKINRDAFVKKYAKEIAQKQDCFTARFMGAAALRDYDGAKRFQDAFPSSDGQNPFYHYGYFDGVLYAKICWKENTIYVPPVQAIQNEDKSWSYPLRDKCELQTSAEGIPICYKRIIENGIYLVEATMRFSEELEEFKQEILLYDADNEDQFAGCMGLRTASTAEEWINICNLRKSEETCEQVGAKVPSTTYFAIREEDKKLVGVIDLRHHIDHPILGTWGGHCGYSVRPTERGNGYAKEMLRLNIQNAKAKGIQKILVTCDENNIASERTIIYNGGVYEKNVEVDGCIMKRYWIETNK